MAIKKSQLYSSLWEACDELRGGMDASQYKDYVLVLLFVKYVSDRAKRDPDSLFEVPQGYRFADIAALKGDKEFGNKINIIITELGRVNGLEGIFKSVDFYNKDKLGSGQEMVDRLSNLVAIFENPALDFSSNRAEGDDLLGDAYEYLMRHFATQSGKSKGQFYTPAEVSRIMAKVIGITNLTTQDKSIYDPTCGSGSLLLKAADEAPGGLTIYGQEMDIATSGLAQMNMILHNNSTAEVKQANTLANPQFLDERTGNLRRFDFAVANPPFSSKNWRTGFDPFNDRYARFTDGVPPTKNGDYAFLLHLLASLKSTGKGAIILPHGVLFRGNVEADIRKSIVLRGYVKGIIGLPANLFFGTGIPACILVLDKQNAAARTDIFMIDASKGFVKDGNKNRLRHQDIHKIVDTFNYQRELPRYSRLVPISEIEANDFNLNIPRYIDSSEAEDLQDIEGHLLGGIPNRDVEDLNRFWQVFPALRQQLFTTGNRSGYSELLVEPAHVKPTVATNAEFAAFAQQVRDTIALWKESHYPSFKALKMGDKPRVLITTLSEDLLRAVADLPLVDPYDVYQHLMAYWTDTMQDDVYMIVADGWCEAAKLRLIIETKDQKKKEKADLTLGKRKYAADLVPVSLLISRYFAAELAEIDRMQAARDEIIRQLEELDEEHSGEDGLLSEVREENGTIEDKKVKDRIKQIVLDPEYADELDVLDTWLALFKKEATAGKALLAARKALNQLVASKYGALTEDEVKTLVVDDKWLPTLTSSMQSELDRVNQTLTGRVRVLAERYASPLPALSAETEALGARVDAHLHRMGLIWN